MTSLPSDQSTPAKTKHIVFLLMVIACLNSIFTVPKNTSNLFCIVNSPLRENKTGYDTSNFRLKNEIKRSI